MKKLFLIIFFNLITIQLKCAPNKADQLSPYQFSEGLLKFQAFVRLPVHFDFSNDWYHKWCIENIARNLNTILRRNTMPDDYDALFNTQSLYSEYSVLRDLYRLVKTMKDDILTVKNGLYKNIEKKIDEIQKKLLHIEHTFKSEKFLLIKKSSEECYDVFTEVFRKLRHYTNKVVDQETHKQIITSVQDAAKQVENLFDEFFPSQFIYFSNNRTANINSIINIYYLVQEINKGKSFRLKELTCNVYLTNAENKFEETVKFLNYCKEIIQIILPESAKKYFQDLPQDLNNQIENLLNDSMEENWEKNFETLPENLKNKIEESWEEYFKNKNENEILENSKKDLQTDWAKYFQHTEKEWSKEKYVQFFLDMTKDPEKLQIYLQDMQKNWTREECRIFFQHTEKNTKCTQTEYTKYFRNINNTLPFNMEFFKRAKRSLTQDKFKKYFIESFIERPWSRAMNSYWIWTKAKYTEFFLDMQDSLTTEEFKKYFKDIESWLQQNWTPDTYEEYFKDIQQNWTTEKYKNFFLYMTQNCSPEEREKYYIQQNWNPKEHKTEYEKEYKKKQLNAWKKEHAKKYLEQYVKLKKLLDNFNNMFDEFAPKTIDLEDFNLTKFFLDQDYQERKLQGKYNYESKNLFEMIRLIDEIYNENIKRQIFKILQDEQSILSEKDPLMYPLILQANITDFDQNIALKINSLLNDLYCNVNLNLSFFNASSNNLSNNSLNSVLQDPSNAFLNSKSENNVVRLQNDADKLKNAYKQINDSRYLQQINSSNYLYEMIVSIVKLNSVQALHKQCMETISKIKNLFQQWKQAQSNNQINNIKKNIAKLIVELKESFSKNRKFIQLSTENMKVNEKKDESKIIEELLFFISKLQEEIISLSHSLQPNNNKLLEDLHEKFKNNLKQNKNNLEQNPNNHYNFENIIKDLINFQKETFNKFEKAKQEAKKHPKFTVLKKLVKRFIQEKKSYAEKILQIDAKNPNIINKFQKERLEKMIEVINEIENQSLSIQIKAIHEDELELVNKFYNKNFYFLEQSNKFIKIKAITDSNVEKKSQISRIRIIFNNIKSFFINLFKNKETLENEATKKLKNFHKDMENIENEIDEADLKVESFFEKTWHSIKNWIIKIWNKIFKN